MQTVVFCIIAAVSRSVVGFDVLGRHRRTDENEIVVKIIAVQDFGRHRIEEGFGQFRLLVIEQ